MIILNRFQPAPFSRGSKTLSALAGLGLMALLSGCGGGGSGLPGNNNLPPVPALPAIAPVTPAQAVNTLTEKSDLPVTGFTITTLDSSISADEVDAVVTQFSIPANVAFPQLASEDTQQGNFKTAAAQRGTFKSGANLGLSQADLNQFFSQNYPLDKIIKPGDSLQNITFQLAGGSTISCLAVLAPNGTIRFCPALTFIPGNSAYPNSDVKQEVASSNGTNALAVQTNRNPFTGVLFYQIPQQVQATVDGGGQVTSTKIVPLEPTFGPGVVLENTSQPVITNTTESTDELNKSGVGKTGTISSALHQSRVITYTVTYTIVLRIRGVVLWRIPVTITTTIRVPIPHTGGG